MFRTALSIALLALAASPVRAQAPAPSAPHAPLPSSIERMVAFAQAQAQDQVRVQVSINYLVSSGADDSSDEASKIREQARRFVYEMAARECALLQQTVAKDCRLEALNVNINRQTGSRSEGFAVRGSMNFRISTQ